MEHLRRAGKAGWQNGNPFERELQNDPVLQALIGGSPEVRYYSKGQHRGNVGEGQLHLTHENIRDFDQYLVAPNDLEIAIKHAFKKEQRLRKRMS